MGPIIDLTQPLENGMSHVPDDVLPVFTPVMEGSWRATVLLLGSHTGTHIDATAHLPRAGSSEIDAYPLERFVLPGVVADVRGRNPDEEIDAAWLSPSLDGMKRGEALVVWTGWDAHWNSNRYLNHPFLSRDAAEAIVAAGASLVAIDALNVDSTPQWTQHVHEILFGNDVLVVENLRGLDQLDPRVRYTFSFLPMKVKGGDAAPTRAVAWADGG